VPRIRTARPGRLSDGSFRTGITLARPAQPIIGSGSYASTPIPAAGEAVGSIACFRGLNQQYQGVTSRAWRNRRSPGHVQTRGNDDQVRVAYGAIRYP